MALNDLEVDTVAGADTNSGSTAGSATASGTGASTDGTSTVDLSADTPDLSSVPVGGSIAIATRTDGIRSTNIYEILTINDGADTITVTPSPGAASGQTWAIGGAWKTLAKQALVVEPGDKVFVKASATYNENFVISIVGTALLPIVLEGYTTTRGDGGRITIDGQATRASAITSSLGNVDHFYTFKNFRCTDHTSHGITFGGTGDQANFFNVRSDNNAGNGLLGDNDIRMIDCEFDSNALIGVDTDTGTTMIGCSVHDNIGAGAVLKLDLVDFCEFYGNGGAQLVVQQGESHIINSTIDGVDKTNIGLSFIGTGVDSISTVINNIITRCSVGISVVDDNGDQQLAKNNLLFDNTVDYSVNWPASAKATDITTDPQFENQAGSDYRLASGSAARGAGYDVGKPVNDVSFMDIGAHQTKATPGIPTIPAFTPGQLTTLKHNNSFIDWAESAGYTIVTDGKERMKLFDPFEESLIELSHLAPKGSFNLTPVGGSPGLTGKFFYVVTVINRSLKDEIESAPLQNGLAAQVGSPVVFIKGAVITVGQRVTVDLSGITRVWFEATHFAIYRSLDVTAADVDPFPVYARVGLVPVGSSPLEFIDETDDDDLDFANNALNIAKGPPPIAPFIEELKSVVFATGFESFSGTGADLTNGVSTLTIPTGQLDEIHVGSEITFGASERAYFIQDLVVSSPFDTITLGDEHLVPVNYEGTTGIKDWFLCSDPTAVRFSEPERPYDWPPINTFQVGRGHGRNTGVLAVRSNLLITKRQETYAYGFNKFAGFGQDFQISSLIGCTSNRTLSVDENGTARWLAVGGIAESNGERVRIISGAISEKFNEVIYDGDKGDLAPRAVGVHDIVNHQYLCTIPTVKASNGIGSREMIVYNYLTGAWSIHEFNVEITELVAARDEDGYPIVLMGDENGFINRWDLGDTDGAGLPGAEGTVRGTVDTYVSSPLPIIRDNSASFFKGAGSPNLDLAGTPVVILSGTGAGQIGVVSNTLFSPPELVLLKKFPTKLDNTSVYALGPIAADHRSGWMDFGTNNMKYLEYMEMSYYIEDSPGDWFLELFVDQPGVANPTIFTFPDGTKASFAFKTDGSDEPVPSGKSSVASVGYRRFKTANLPFRLLQWRIQSPYSKAPGTIFTVTPRLRAGDN